MSNNHSVNSSDFAAWRASVTRSVTNGPSSIPGRSAPASRPPPIGQETMDQTDQHEQPKSHGRQKKAKKWQPLDLAAVAPSSSGLPQQTGSRAGSGVGDAHQGPQNANSRRGTNLNFNHAHHQGRRPAARNQGLGHPIDMNGLSRGVNSLAIGGLRTLPAQEPGVPLTKFTIFGKLPAEMRLKIWGLALNTERILEVIWDGAEKDPKTASHYHYRISPRSGARPKLMDNGTSSCSANTHACGQSFVSFRTSVVPMWTFTALAIVSIGQLLKCHDWNHDDPTHGPDKMEVDYGYAIASGCTVMQALHGIHKEVAWTERASGVKGLKEVFFVVPTHLIPGIAGKVDESIGFRPARGCGLTSGQVKVKNNLQDEVDLIEAGGVLPYCSVDDSMNNWSRENKPEFKFVTFTPKSHIHGKVFDLMIVSTEDLPKLNGHDWKFIKNVERKSGCHLKIPSVTTQLSNLTRLDSMARNPALKRPSSSSRINCFSQETIGPSLSLPRSLLATQQTSA
ncbi:hypothetical protein DL98DRAFT_567922 [Cadophora sp. DSE1049]|nr:hypothetical protein DL98DRAFT_567922 [Cadophora sp. DSE1049]